MTKDLANIEPDISEVDDHSSVWEPFDWGRANFKGLAPYVSQRSLRGLRLNADIGHLLTTADGAAADRAIAELLFNTLKDRQIHYAIEPWTGLTPQQIRHPRWLVEDGWGTCLDLAVTYAAMCLEAHLGPLLAITDTHALVVLEPGRLRDTTAVPPWSPSWAADNDAKPAQGILGVADVDALQSELDSGALMAIDIVMATTTHAEDFRAALHQGRRSLAHGVTLIDVAFLHTNGEPPLPPPTERPTIRTYLPGGQRRFVRYPSHREVLDGLRADEGVVVLIGPQGQGKSTLARQLVRDAPFGAGWFLNASEPQTLVTSLADADLAEQNERAAGLAGPDRKGFSDSALAHLAEAKGRWIVVLDNADGDPGKITPLLPHPGDGQLVVITTTNREWESVAGVRVRHLPSIDDEHIAKTLQGDQLTPLVAGRALLLHAFSALLTSTGAGAAEISGHAPAPGDVEEPARGPATLWAALRVGSDPEILRFCLQLAYLPPDQQPVAALAALKPGATDLIEQLTDGGLLTREAGFIRMHRLFGAAVRADLYANEPAMDADVVLELATNADAFKVFDRYGDQATLMRLDDRLTEIDEATEGHDTRLGEALHSIAELLELAGHTRRSGETFARAERHLHDRPDLLADVLHSRARTVNQHHAREEQLLREALGWAEEAERILLATPGRESGADKCLAMQGLLRQKLAAFPREGETTLGLLHDALDVIEEAHRRREVRLDPMDPELARSEFNLAGIRINLAQREPERTREHLDEADRVYKSVAKRREEIYERRVHPHIAACIIGQGYVDYYRALLLTASPVTRAGWLREATAHANDALLQRQALEGSLDRDESKKTLRFLAKVTLARQSSTLRPAQTLESVASEVSRELAFAAVQTLPSNALELTDPIAGWLFSPALGAVVAAFDGTPPPPAISLDEALAWFEDFSARWDYRAGQERNVVAAQDLTPEIEATVMKAAPALGLVGTSPPPSDHYDHVLVLGGLVRACMARPLYAAKLLTESTIKARDITALGGYRPLSDNELELAAKLGCSNLSDEFEAMDAGVKKAFSVIEPVAERGERSDTVGASWAVREYRTSEDVTVRVVGAPSSEPGVRRANTADTYAWYASELVKLRADERVLIVTSDIYVPFQHADALRMLAMPYSVEVDSAGIRPGDAHPDLAQVFQAHNYLQEIRSTIRALRALYTAWRGDS